MNREKALNAAVAINELERQNFGGHNLPPSPLAEIILREMGDSADTTTKGADVLTPKRQHVVCNNCASTKAGDECHDCTLYGCDCDCHYPVTSGAAPEETERDAKMQDDYAEACKFAKKLDWDDWELAWTLGAKFGQARAALEDKK